MTKVKGIKSGGRFYDYAAASEDGLHVLIEAFDGFYRSGATAYLTPQQARKFAAAIQAAADKAEALP